MEDAPGKARSHRAIHCRRKASLNSTNYQNPCRVIYSGDTGGRHSKRWFRQKSISPSVPGWGVGGFYRPMSPTEDEGAIAKDL